MRVAISGTPGTGKTTLSQLVAEKLDWHYCDLNSYLTQLTDTLPYDWDRSSVIVPTHTLQAVADQLPAHSIIIDGHLSHQIPALDLVCVLRTAPSELHKRLLQKGWSSQKIQENVNAEEVDVILIEACEMNNSVCEINTTDTGSDAVSNTIRDIIAKPSQRSRYPPGTIDWLA